MKKKITRMRLGNHQFTFKVAVENCNRVSRMDELERVLNFQIGFLMLSDRISNVKVSPHHSIPNSSVCLSFPDNQLEIKMGINEEEKKE